MVDSVLFRIHNLELHKHFVDFLKTEFRGGVQIDKLEEVYNSEEEYDFIWNRRRLHSKIFIDHGTSKRTIESFKHFIKSHHYDIHYRINYLRDFIDFNLSIPKLLYGTNVFQFVNHFYSKKYPITTTSKFSDKILQEDLYSRFVSFFDWFFTKYFGSKPDYAYLSFVRIDFCYNQVFTVREEALKYLEDIKNVKKVGLRKSSNSFSTHEGGYYLKGRNCTYKIYHKGIEFKKHDYNKTKKIYGQSLADECQKFADRVIRYEVEVWHKGWNYYWARYVLANKNIKWKKYRDLALNLDKHGSIKRGGRLITYIDLSKVEKSYVKRVRKVLARTRDFTLGGELFLDDPLEVDTDQRVRMSPRLFLRGFKQLRKFVKEYSLAELSRVHDFLMSIENPDEGARSLTSLVKSERFKQMVSHLPGIDPKLYSWPKFKMISELLKYNTWDEIKDSKVVSRSTYFLYLKLFTLLFDSRSFQTNNIHARNELESFQAYSHFYMTVHTRFKFTHYFF